MLVLTRHEQQKTFLTLPGGIEVMVLVIECRDGKVRLGFDAPLDVQITRDDAHSLRPARPREDAPESAGNGPPRDWRTPATHPATPKPGEPGYVPLRRREGR